MQTLLESNIKSRKGKVCSSLDASVGVFNIFLHFFRLNPTVCSSKVAVCIHKTILSDMHCRGHQFDGARKPYYVSHYVRLAVCVEFSPLYCIHCVSVPPVCLCLYFESSLKKLLGSAV